MLLPYSVKMLGSQRPEAGSVQGVLFMFMMVMPIAVALRMAGSRVFWLPWGVAAVAEIQHVAYTTPGRLQWMRTWQKDLCRIKENY